MKIGMRKPSLKKSFKARTTGKMKRKGKKAINPLYGKKGMGWINDPKKAENFIHQLGTKKALKSQPSAYGKNGI